MNYDKIKEYSQMKMKIPIIIKPINDGEYIKIKKLN